MNSLIKKIHCKLETVKIHLRSFFNSLSTNNRINHKIVHIMFNDKFNKPFFDFINQNFDNDRHLFLWKYSFPEQPILVGSNAVRIEMLKYLHLERAKKIICHSLFDDELVKYLYVNKKALKKSYWFVWGGDFYEYDSTERDDYVRKNVFAYINKVDEKLIRVKYNRTDDCFFDAKYCFPITMQMIINAKKHLNNTDTIKIQINNSSDSSTLEILNVLSKYKNENIHIVTVLSYGNLEFKKEIIKTGNDIFEDKFSYIEKYMSPEEYALYIANQDILILNQHRQQGMGNTNAFLALGKKVFIRSDVSTYEYYNDVGARVFDTLTISNLSFEEFIDNPACEQNKIIALNFFDNSVLAEQWRKIFD